MSVTIFYALRVNNMFPFMVKIEPNGELLLRILLEFDILIMILPFCMLLDSNNMFPFIVKQTQWRSLKLNVC